MTKGHRFFHRRAGTQVVTVNVEVVATVDTHGSLIAEETRAPVTPKAEIKPTVAVLPAGIEPSATPQAQQPLPTVPSVPAMPSVPTPALPAVPSVPPFPSDLVVPTVPAFPFPSGTPVQDVVNPESASPAPYSANLPQGTASPEGTAAPEGTASPSADLAQVSSSAGNSFSNSTMPSTSTSFYTSSSSSLDDVLATILAAPATSSSAISSAPSSVQSSVLSSAPSSETPLASPSESVSAPTSFISSGRPSSSGSLTTPISAHSTTIVPDAATTSTHYGGGSSQGGSSQGGNSRGGSSSSSEATQVFGAPPAASTAAISDANADGSSAPMEMPQVVGSVVGSLAGAALILAIILLLLRRHKRKQGGALQLTGHDHTDTQQTVTQAPISRSLVPAAFLPRFSAMSGKTAETSTSAGEKSFQRVSGRKLPSAFSEGMTSDQFSRGGTMSGSSFYTDDQGTYGGYAVSKEFGKETGDAYAGRESGQMNFRPSPARTPVIRHPDDDVNPFADPSYLSPPQSPKFDLTSRGSRPTLGRSLASQDGSRSSRFTENV